MAHDVEKLRVGRYVIDRPLGQGGMAQVYLCRRVGAGGFERQVVLKVLNARFLSEGGAAAMFIEEARVLARLHHPNIVDVFEVENVHGVPFFAMEYIRGPTWADVLRHVGRPARDTMGPMLEIVRQVCDALHYAHTLEIDGRPKGLVHRDVSSQNVLVDATNGLAKLIDFGIAKAADSPFHTQTGVFKGKPTYMAPEVLRGSSPDARADLYAVGILLFRTFAGRLPYRRLDAGPPFEPPPIPFDELPNDPELRELVRQTLSSEADKRPESAAAIARELSALAAKYGAGPSDVASFIARVFPGGESDWRLPDELVSSSPHVAIRALARLMEEPAPRPRSRWVTALVAMAIAVTVALSTGVFVSMYSATERQRATTVTELVRAADRHLASGDPRSALPLNARASALNNDPMQGAAISAQHQRIVEAMGRGRP